MIRIAALLLVLSGPAFADGPRVAVDIVPTASLVARVMEGVGAPTLVIPAGASPHGYAMRPSEAAALERADLIVRIGPALTPWFEEAVTALAPEAGGLVLLDAPGTMLRASGEGHDDHDHGHEQHTDYAAEADRDEDHADHDHGYGASAASGEPVDPHAWLDPLNGAAWLPAIAEALAAADPDNAATYRANAEAGAAELRALETALTTILSPVRDRAYLTLHDAYGYFEGRTGVDSAGSVRLSDAADAGPAHLAELRARMGGIACLFTEPQLDDRLARRLLEGTGTRLVTLDPIGTDADTGPDGYANVLRRMARDMAACLAP